MKVVLAIDSFKGSLTSLEAGEAAGAGILRACPGAETVICPLADGGEGTAQALLQGMHGETLRVTVPGPLGDPVECVYGVVGGDTVVLEMAGAAGLTLLPAEKRNPLYTTTYGFGLALRDAIDRGYRRFILGIGGSATNDGGVGMLQALGFRMLDDRGEPVQGGARGLSRLCRIEADAALPALCDCTFRVACDVSNPLCGENGCSAVYGPQKGATPAQIKEMDAWLKRYAALAKSCFPESDADFPGAGAAGGMGFALKTFLGASLESGSQIVLEETGLREKIRDADIVVTGEGRLDGQTAMGKAPIGVARLASSLQKPVLAFSGCVGAGASLCNENGILAYFPILRSATSLEEAMNRENAARNLADTAEQVFRLIAALTK